MPDNVDVIGASYEYNKDNKTITNVKPKFEEIAVDCRFKQRRRTSCTPSCEKW